MTRFGRMGDAVAAGNDAALYWHSRMRVTHINEISDMVSHRAASKRTAWAGPRPHGDVIGLLCGCTAFAVAFLVDCVHELVFDGR